MGEAGAKTIVCALVIVLANQAAGQYGDRSSSQVVENPRVERSGSENPAGCEGGWCKSQREGPVGTIWFGPRLGRRRRSDGKFPLGKAEPIAEIVDLPILDLIGVPASGMQRVGPSGLGGEDKRQETTFTPRLGRELEAGPMRELAQLLYYQMRELDELQDQQQQQQPPPPPPNFPPRLGRNLVDQPAANSARLLREYELRQLLQRLGA